MLVNILVPLSVGNSVVLQNGMGEMWGKKSWIHWREGNFGVTYPHQKTRWNDLGTFCLGQFWQKLGKEETDFWIKLKFVVVSQLLAKEPNRFSMLLPAIYLGARVIHRYSNFLGGVRSEVKGSRSEWVAGSGGLPLRAVKIPKILTLLKSNSENPWKRRGWKTKYSLLGRLIFRGLFC